MRIMGPRQPPPPPTNIAGTLNIIAFTDGRPIEVRTSGSASDALRMIARALTGLAELLEKQGPPAPEPAPEPEKPKYMGPRVYGPDGEKK